MFDSTLDHETAMNSHKQEQLLLSRLTQTEQASSLDDEDFADNLITEEAQSVVTYEWDSQSPGGSGACCVNHWRGLYFVAGSDYESEGPFDSIQSAFGSEAFEALSGNLQFTYTSRIVKRSQLLDLIARSFVGDEGDTIRVNGAEYVYRSGSFKKRSASGV
jgi:hypothetical protein